MSWSLSRSLTLFNKKYNTRKIKITDVSSCPQRKKREMPEEKKSPVTEIIIEMKEKSFQVQETRRDDEQEVKAL